MIRFNRNIRPWALALAALMIGEAFMTSTHAQVGGDSVSDLEGRKRMYTELKIEVGDGRYNELRDVAIADAILGSKFASSQTKALAAKYKDDYLFNQILVNLSWMLPVGYWVGARLGIQASAPNFPSDDVINLLQYTAIGFLVIGGASIFALENFGPRLPMPVVEAYNEDLRIGLNLSERDLIGL